MSGKPYLTMYKFYVMALSSLQPSIHISLGVGGKDVGGSYNQAGITFG